MKGTIQQTQAALPHQTVLVARASVREPKERAASDGASDIADRMDHFLPGFSRSSGQAKGRGIWRFLGGCDQSSARSFHSQGMARHDRG